MAKVPGSIFRRTLFWAHLCSGVAAGILIFIMSATGVLIAYQGQIIKASADANRVTLPADAVRLSADQLIEKARAAAPAGGQLNLIFDADPSRPVTVAAGRQQLLLNPQTGEVLPDAAAGTRSFFRWVEDLHRWLGGAPDSTAANLLDVANLLFLFIIASGIYLWLPEVWKSATVRALTLFRSRYVNSKARDFAWHHVFSFWMFIPLFLIALSGVVMSYPLANRLLFSAFGEQPPQQQQRGPAGAAPGMNAAPRSGEAAVADAPPQRANAQQLLDVARSTFSNWQRITLPAGGRGETINLTADLKSDELRTPRQALTLSTADASVIRLAPPNPGPGSTQSPGQRARAWMRFVHTGEEYGFTGQTIAALASLAACFLAYTGLALAWRRLIVPIYRGN